MKKIILFLGVFVLTASVAYGAEESSKTTISSKVELISANDLLKKVSSQKGKVIVVNIFASWCPPCREEIPGIIETRKSFSEDELYLVGVSVDKNATALESFIPKYSFNYPLFIAAENFVETFGVNAIPQMLIYNKKGALVLNHKGYIEEKELTALISEQLAKK